MKRYLLTIVMSFICVSSLTGQYVSMIDTTGFDSLYSVFLKNNPELQIQRENIQQKREQVFLSKVSFLRNLRFGFQFYRSSSTIYQTESQYVPRLGVSISLDFESLFTTKSRIRQANSEVSVAYLDSVQISAKLKVDLFVRFVGFKKALKSYQLQLARTQSANEIFKMAEKRFANGEIPLDQYSAARDDRAAAENDLLTAEMELQIAKASLLELLEGVDESR